MARPMEIPLEVTAPAGATQVAVEMDLATVVEHVGAAGADLDRLEARAADGRSLAAQWLPPVAGVCPPQLVLELPEGGAAPLPLTLAQREGGAPSRVVFNQDPDKVVISLDGRPFATYLYNTRDPELRRPFFHPILAPHGEAITQVGEIPGTKQAHFHHTGLVIAHQNFTDGNNWQMGDGTSRILHQAFDAMESGPLVGRFVERLDWPNKAETKVLVKETRVVSVPYRPAARRVLDVQITLEAQAEPVTFNPTPYHILAVRVPDAMVQNNAGETVNSEGQKGGDTAGKPARWLDIAGPLPKTWAGVALFDHPGNFRHPTPWLNFENETVGAAPTYHQPYTLKPGEKLTLRYRVLVHPGNAAEGRIAQEYEAWTKPASARVGTLSRQ